MREKLLLPDGKLAGYYYPTEAVWRKFGVKTKHLMKKFGGVPGWDEGILLKLVLNRPAGLRRLSAHISGGTAIRMNDIGWFLAVAEPHDYGSGRQLFVHRKFWEVEEASAVSSRGARKVPGGGRTRRSRPRTGAPSLA